MPAPAVCCTRVHMFGSVHFAAPGAKANGINWKQERKAAECLRRLRCEKPETNTSGFSFAKQKPAWGLLQSKPHPFPLCFPLAAGEPSCHPPLPGLLLLAAAADKAKASSECQRWQRCSALTTAIICTPLLSVCSSSETNHAYKRKTQTNPKPNPQTSTLNGSQTLRARTQPPTSTAPCD